MDLFSFQQSEQPQARLLADRMRPETLDEYIGQEHIVGTGKLLRRAIEGDQVSSILFYGPPGCGKTTLAHIISKKTEGVFVRLNAVDASVKDVRETIEQAKSNKALYGRKTILFLDEVHRFNTARQDALLPAVEQGIIIFIGATTENPFHHVNGALLSRSTLFQLEPLTKEHSKTAMRRALADAGKGLGFMQIRMEEDALEHLASMAGGDIRRALNALELAAVTTPSQPDGSVHITIEVAEESIRKPTVRADESTQYDVLSAFHKSVRGSSDAALFWFLYAVEKLGMDDDLFAPPYCRLQRGYRACEPAGDGTGCYSHGCLSQDRLAGGEIQYYASDTVRRRKPEIQCRRYCHQQGNGYDRLLRDAGSAAASAGYALPRC